MSRVRQVTDRHFVAALTDEEYRTLRVKAAEAGLKVKQWVQIAILEKLRKEE